MQAILVLTQRSHTPCDNGGFCTNTAGGFTFIVQGRGTMVQSVVQVSSMYTGYLGTDKM